MRPARAINLALSPSWERLRSGGTELHGTASWSQVKEAPGQLPRASLLCLRTLLGMGAASLAGQCHPCHLRQKSWQACACGGGDGCARPLSSAPMRGLESDSRSPSDRITGGGAAGRKDAIPAGRSYLAPGSPLGEPNLLRLAC